jgi:hypothetical protein
MRLSLLIALVGLLCGCSSSKSPATKPDPTPLPGAQPTQTFGAKQDKADQKVSASISAAREAIPTNPAGADKELQVAQSYLPAPTPEDVALSRQRISKNDSKEFQTAQENGKKLAAELEDLWAKMEAQQAKASRDITELKRQLDDRQLALEQARKDKASTMLSLVGAGILAVGTLLVAFGHFIGISKFNAALVILCGVATVSLPWVFDSSYFPWVVGVTLAVIGIEVTVVLWRKMTTKPVQCPDIQEEAKPQPEDQPNQ